jgi:hypothetical protein
MEGALSLRLWNFIILKLAPLMWVLLSFYDTILNFRLSDVFFVVILARILFFLVGNFILAFI